MQGAASLFAAGFKGMVDEPHSREVEEKDVRRGRYGAARGRFLRGDRGNLCVSTAPPNRSRLSLLAWPVARSLKSLEIMNFDEMVWRMTSAPPLGRYNAPNHDEIDRLLLEEEVALIILRSRLMRRRGAP